MSARVTRGKCAGVDIRHPTGHTRPRFFTIRGPWTPDRRPGPWSRMGGPELASEKGHTHKRYGGVFRGFLSVSLSVNWPKRPKIASGGSLECWLGSRSTAWAYLVPSGVDCGAFFRS